MTKGGSKSRWILAAVVVAALLAAASEAAAQLFTFPETYAGDLWSRPRLTGDWGGFRDTLAKKGIMLDVDLLQLYQAVASGGKNTDDDYFGWAGYTLYVDFGRAGLWPGGFLKIKGESSFGGDVNGAVSAVSPVNAASLFPVPLEQSTTLTSVVLTQFLSEWFGVFLGKLETLDAAATEFGGDHRTKFLNTAFDLNLTQLATVPYAGLGGGIIVVPAPWLLFTALAMDTGGKADESGFDSAFEVGTTVAAGLTLTIKPFGLPGYQRVGYSWSSKQYLSLHQDPSNLFRLALFNEFPRLQNPGPILRRIIERFFPSLLVPTEDLKKQDGSWAITYGFDQYLWAEKDKDGKVRRGIGVFFNFGVSDGEANPVKYFYNAGMGGKGVIPSRPLDTFGIGWYGMDLSDRLFPLLRERLGLGLKNEQGWELYYSFAITPWLFATPDLQIIRPALRKTLQDGALKALDTAVVAGFRLYARF